MRPVWTHHTPSIPPIASSIRVRASWTHYPSCLVRAPTWFWHPSCLPSTDRFSFSIPVVVVVVVLWPSRTSPRSVAHSHRYPLNTPLATCFRPVHQGRLVQRCGSPAPSNRFFRLLRVHVFAPTLSYSELVRAHSLDYKKDELSLKKRSYYSDLNSSRTLKLHRAYASTLSIR